MEDNTIDEQTQRGRTVAMKQGEKPLSFSWTYADFFYYDCYIVHFTYRLRGA